MTITAARPTVGMPCSHCGSALVSERQATPWCAACGWNLDFYDPDRKQRELRWTWADRLSFQAAYDLNEQQFAALRGRPVGKPGFSLAKVAVMTLALVGLAFDIGLALFGLWLIMSVGSLVPDVLGAVAILVAFALRPRLGRLDKYAEPIELSSLPAMDRLFTRVATEIGAPKPSVLLFDSTFNAWSGTYGLFRRRYVRIGIPLWLSLTPSEQAGLVGHELGHFVNGDVRRGPLSRYAFRLLGALSAMTRPDMTAQFRRRRAYGMGRGMSAFAEVLLRPIFLLMSLCFGLMELGVEWLTMRASHHAEYAADEMSARAAGSAAMSGCLDMMILGEACETVVTRAVRADPSPQIWRAAAAEARGQLAPRLPRLRQLTMREDASLGVSHPPTGLRAQLLESRPPTYATIGHTEAESAEIDRELASVYRTYRTEVRA
jgi:Zn-dependent protease with chaperone function